MYRLECWKLDKIIEKPSNNIGKVDNQRVRAVLRVLLMVQMGGVSEGLDNHCYVYPLQWYMYGT